MAGVVAKVALICIVLHSLYLAASALFAQPRVGVDHKGAAEFRCIAVADLDELSQEGTKPLWKSSVLEISLVRDSSGDYSFLWSQPQTLKGGYSYGGRGMELSELQYWNGKLMTFDDRTGMVFELKKKGAKYTLRPVTVVVEGDGQGEHGAKLEWATLKDGALVVGGAGKEWTSMVRGVPDGWDPVWVHYLGSRRSGSTDNHQEHVDWKGRYGKIRHALKADYPTGYVIHEAVLWSDIKQRWYFLPRRVSRERFTKANSKTSGSNVMAYTGQDFESVQVVNLGPWTPLRGYSTMKFVPGTGDDHILALKTEEHSDGSYRTYATVISVSAGRQLTHDVMISNSSKYEGIEFLQD